jgi:PAS domain S-box-containing protein
VGALFLNALNIACIFKNTALDTLRGLARVVKVRGHTGCCKNAAMEENKQTSRESGSKRRFSLPLFVLGCGLAATALATYLIKENLAIRDRQHLQEARHQIERTIDARMEAYLGLLRGGGGLFAANRQVTLDQFRKFYQRLEVEENYPGLQGFGYSVHFAPDKLAVLEQSMRDQGLRDFKVWPDTPRDDYHSIVFLEPRDDRNRRALGFDMFTEAKRRRAMTEARDSGEPRLTGKVQLVQEVEGDLKQPGFLLYLPLYLGGSVPADVNERREKLQGFIYSPFRAGDLFRGVSSSIHLPGLAFAIWDSTNTSPENLFFQSSRAFDRKQIGELTEIEFAGAEWTLGVSQLPGGPSLDGANMLWVVPVLGIIASLLLCYFTYTEIAQSLQRERAERALAESEGLYRAISETAADGIVVIDEQSRIVTANRAMEQIFGYPAEALVSQPLKMLMPERMHAAHERAMQRFVDTGQKKISWSGVELPGLHLDGTEIPLEISFGAARRGSGYLFTGFIRDIRWRKESERQLRETEERFALLVRLAEEYAIIIMGSDGRITTWNPGAQRIFGYADAEVVGRDGAIFFTKEDRAAGILEKQLHKAKTEGQVLDERWQVRKDGSQFWASGSMVCLRAEDGTVRGFAKILRDITERKRTEESIKELNQELESRVQKRTAALQESKEQMEAFSYTVAHDLRAPLRAMQGFAHALMDDYQPRLDQPAVDYLRRIMSSAERMDALIQDLLEYSRLSGSDLTFRAVPVEEAVQNALDRCREEIQRAGAEVRVQLEHTAVKAHPATLENALSNLLANAVKFTKPNEKPLLSVRAMEQGETVQISVQDNGIGIAPEHHGRIFRVFERLHAEHAYPGTGIGLAIVKKGVERMGGRVGLNSEPGEGSLFWIELPKATEPD